MGQAEVQQIFLQNGNEWMSAMEIAEILRVHNVGLIRRALTSMFKYGEVLRRCSENCVHGFRYEYKLKLIEGVIQ